MTDNELWAAIHEALGTTTEPDNAFTVPELAGWMGWGEAKARKVVKGLVSAKKARPVRVPRAGIDGVVQPVRAYELTV